jgi:putative hydrolase of the HAD superfamily
MTRAVFFDVDFTLIRPGPMFQAEGYRSFCARHGIAVDASAFDGAVRTAAPLLDGPEDTPYDGEIFVDYTRRIIEEMGGCGDRLDACAREICAEWGTNHHFELYDDVPPTLRELARVGIRVGLISNSHRCLESFQSYFELDGLVAGAVSSSEHGFMKPHPSIFLAAMQLMDVAPAEAVMVGDSVRQDVEGALRAGMRAVLLDRGERAPVQEDALIALGVPVIRSLTELPPALAGSFHAMTR